MQPTVRRRLLVVLASLTLALLVADLAGWAVADGVRRAGGLVLGPVQRALAGAPRDELAAVESENVRLRAVAAEQQHRLDELGRLDELLGSSATTGRTLVPARVVATDLSALGGRSVTIDVGSRDGDPHRLDGRGGRRSRRPRRGRVAVDERRPGARQRRLGRGGARRPRRHARHGVAAGSGRLRVPSPRLAPPRRHRAVDPRRRRRRAHPRQRRRDAVCRRDRRRHRDRRRPRPGPADAQRDGAPRRRPRRDRRRRRPRAHRSLHPETGGHLPRARRRGPRR